MPQEWTPPGDTVGQPARPWTCLPWTPAGPCFLGICRAGELSVCALCLKTDQGLGTGRCPGPSLLSRPFCHILNGRRSMYSTSGCEATGHDWQSGESHRSP